MSRGLLTKIVPDADAPLNSYLSQLLQSDVGHLRQSISQTNRSLADSDIDLSHVAFNHYPSFVTAAEAQDEVGHVSETLKENLVNNLQSQLDSVQTLSKSFLEKTQDFSDHQVLLDKSHTHLEPIKMLMSAPFLLDACIKIGYWKEAVDIGYKVRTAYEKSPSQPLVRQIHSRVEETLNQLYSHVIDSLRARNLKFSSAVRALDTLSHLVEFHKKSSSKRALQVQSVDAGDLERWFLKARAACLEDEFRNFWEIWVPETSTEFSESQIITLSTSTSETTATQALQKYLDAWREIIGDVISMYTEAFVPGNLSSKEHIIRYQPLNQMLTQTLNELYALIELVVPKIYSTYTLSQIMTQLSYCSSSFAKRGFDFFPISQLTQTISSRTLELFAWHLNLGTKKLDYLMQQIPSSKDQESFLAEWLNHKQEKQTPWVPQLPRFFVQVPLLTAWTNYHINGLNTLRMLPLDVIRPALLEEQNAAFDKLLESLLNRKQAITYPELSRYMDAVAEVASEIVIPWCRQSLHRAVFPHSEVNEPLSASTVEWMKKLSSSCETAKEN